MSAGAQNMKTDPDALGSAEMESGRAKHENGTRRLRYRRKRVRTGKTLKRHPTPSVLLKMSPEEQNMKTGPNALSTPKNENGRAKHKIGT
jgi:hypothetical protein